MSGTERTLAQIAERLTELAREEIDDATCSCDEALALRAELARTRGCAIHLAKAGGYWTIELWQGGLLRETYVGETRAQAALERASEFMRRIELPANVARNGERT